MKLLALLIPILFLVSCGGSSSNNSTYDRFLIDDYSTTTQPSYDLTGTWIRTEVSSRVDGNGVITEGVGRRIVIINDYETGAGLIDECPHNPHEWIITDNKLSYFDTYTYQYQSTSLSLDIVNNKILTGVSNTEVSVSPSNEFWTYSSEIEMRKLSNEITQLGNLKLKYADGIYGVYCFVEMEGEAIDLSGKKEQRHTILIAARNEADDIVALHLTVPDVPDVNYSAVSQGTYFNFDLTNGLINGYTAEKSHHITLNTTEHLQGEVTFALNQYGLEETVEFDLTFNAD